MNNEQPTTNAIQNKPNSKPILKQNTENLDFARQTRYSTQKDFLRIIEKSS